MNYKLIFQLSLFGLVMAFLTVFWIPFNLEPAFWAAIFIISAYSIALKSSGKYFMTGFWVGIANYVWITVIHLLFFHTYIVNHPHEMQLMTKIFVHHTVRWLLVADPVLGIISGLILGLFAFIVSKIMQKK